MILKTDAQINRNRWSDVTSFVTMVAAFSVQKNILFYFNIPN